jgi:competence protein ComEA
MEKTINFINKNKIYIICFIIVIISLISIFIQKKDRENTMKVNSQEINQKDGKIAVYITGAVKNPGVYYLDENSRLNNLLDICGGVLENADINNLNLSKKLVDSDKITVTLKQENTESSIDNTGENTSDEEGNETSENKQTEKININTANQNQLMELPGVGESTAKKIIEYRKTTKFVEIEDVMNVSGIGDSKFNSMKDSICVE